MFSRGTPDRARRRALRPYRWMEMTPTDAASSASSGDREVVEATDCPECGARSSVRWGVCEVCYAEFDEFPLQPMDASDDFAEPLL